MLGTFNNNSEFSKKFALITGITTTFIGLYICYVDFLDNKISIGILLLSLGIMQICNFLLIPHVSVKDERSKQIKEKSMSVSYYFFLIVMFMTLLITESSYLNLNMSTKEILIILISVYIISIHITMIFFSKRI
ncbi:hypothetical protein AEA09_18940 [Lysinibacillus contaminans]|uniref:Permease n=1 Tax=Lysinibacillus contaminans TaxID=1293441 RepID=A0ABR5JVW9_9BACI|nr:hypothetical protein [Lysinibacillus contaminans]KOS66292.1 hypothetical protein AEA09_18940 [Lysinibacillus contaminans]